MEAPRTIRARARDGDRESWSTRVALTLLVLGVTGGLLLIAAELSTIVAVELPGRTCREVADPGTADRCELSGFERHGGAFLLLGVLALAMAVGAARRRSRPAAMALIVIAVVVLGFALLRDLPEANETGAVGISFEGASAAPGRGLFLEVGAGLLLAAAGALALTRGRAQPDGP
jgi:hypothetical protein